MRKICILSPGRCGSLLLFSYLRIHFCDHYENLIHTHDVNEAQSLEAQGFSVITMRRRSMFEWTLSRCISDLVLSGNMKNEESFHLNNRERIEIPFDKYHSVRNNIINEVRSYNQKWSVYFYEDLIDDPFSVVNTVLKGRSPVPSKKKLSYIKSNLVINYEKLKEFEESGLVLRWNKSINTLSQD